MFRLYAITAVFGQEGERIALNHSLRYRVLLVTADCDGDDVSEAYNAYKWVSELAKICDVTLLTEYNCGRRAPSEQIRNARVLDWERPRSLAKFERFRAMAKPDYIRFFFKARSQIRRLLDAGEQFDLFHQITPNAVRIPSLCYGFGVPYIVGPKAGGLPTPATFAGEVLSAPLYMHLRSLDRVRLRYDPLLRKSYTQAALVIGAAPYVRQILSPIELQRFEVEFDAGIDGIVQSSVRHAAAEVRRPTRLLYVGRAIRTKGLRDVVRAMGQLGGSVDVTLTVAGDGEELSRCRREAEELNVAGRITFLGLVPRHVVEDLYAEADIFVYPSFREPGGGVLLEAMRRGLPVITTDVGGPGYLVDESSGIKVPVHNPTQLVSDLAGAIKRLAGDRATLQALSDGARARVADIGLWDGKIDRMIGLYESVIASSRAAR